MTVNYLVDSVPANASFPQRVEFFLAESDEQEGQAFLGSATHPESEPCSPPQGNEPPETGIETTA